MSAMDAASTSPRNGWSHSASGQPGYLAAIAPSGVASAMDKSAPLKPSTAKLRRKPTPRRELSQAELEQVCGGYTATDDLWEWRAR